MTLSLMTEDKMMMYPFSYLARHGCWLVWGDYIDVAVHCPKAKVDVATTAARRLIDAGFSCALSVHEGEYVEQRQVVGVME